MKKHTAIEALEPRIAPAAIFTFTDVDGDLVTVKTSKGTNAELAAVVATGVVAGSVPAGVAITTINLAANAVFDGTDLNVTAKPGPLGGDGLVNVSRIAAAGLDLGTVKIIGDLQDLDAGKGTVTSKITTIDVQSTTGTGIWTLNGNVGTLKVAHDLRGSEISMPVPDTTLGLLKIGGSLIGGGALKTGYISADSIGKIIIGGSVIGSTAPASGAIQTFHIGSVTIGGSIIGGGGLASGQIYGFDGFGAVKIGRDVIGGGGDGSGVLRLGKVTTLTIGGSILGGSGQNGASVRVDDVGSVKIGGSIIGGSGVGGGDFGSNERIGSLKLGGDFLAGSGSSTALIYAGDTIGPIKIGGNIIGTVTQSATIAAGTVTGGSQLAIKSLTVGGLVHRADIYCFDADAQFGSIKVGGDWSASNLHTGITEGADMVFGTADDGVESSANNPALFSKIASITIGGQVVGTPAGTDHFGFVSQEIGSLKIHGVKVPLTKGRGNDTDVDNTRFNLGVTRDVTVHEVA